MKGGRKIKKEKILLIGKVVKIKRGKKRRMIMHQELNVVIRFYLYR